MPVADSPYITIVIHDRKADGRREKNDGEGGRRRHASHHNDKCQKKMVNQLFVDDDIDMEHICHTGHILSRADARLAPSRDKEMMKENPLQ